jgi:tetratricopeptide (TPR) repeat protein
MAGALPDQEQILALRQMLARAAEAHQRGQLAEAEALYLHALRERPGLFDAQNLLGVLRSQQGRYDEALALVGAALKTMPNAVGALMNYGLILHKMKRHEEALASFEKALALRPDHAGALNNRGIVLATLGREHAALASYWRAVTAMPDYADAHNNMGVLLKELGWLTEAEAALSKALELNPKLTSAYVNLADCKTFQAGDAHLAAMLALERDDSLTRAERVHLHFALGKAFADLKDHDRAFEYLLRANREKRALIHYDEAAVMRLFDRIEATFTRDLVAAKAGAGDPSPVPIFIIGMPRSGTSLIEQILASHHRVHGAGELSTLSDLAGSVYGPDGQLVRYPDFVPEVDGEVFRPIGSYYVGAVRKLAPDAGYIVDKMPSNFFFAGMIHLALPNARIIHVVRDPVDTCVSCFFQMFTGELNHTYDLAELGRYYRRYQRLMAHWHKVLPPGRILEVRYEDVVADLETESRRILTHCGLDWDPRCLRFHHTDRRVRTASATQVRQPIYTSALGRGKIYQPYLGALFGELFPADQVALSP